MNIHKQNAAFKKTLISIAVVAACAPAYAQSDLSELTKPDSTVSIGVGYVDGNKRNASLSGQYNGLRDESGVLLLDIDSTKRDDATGVVMTIKGSNLGLDNREFSFAREKQGDWRYSLDYSEQVRHDPRTINTGMTGLGTTTNTVVRLGGNTLGSAAAPGTGTDQDFKLKRVGLGLAGEKWINSNLQFELSFKNEDKTGDRAISRGYDCAAYVCSGTQGAASQKWALLLLDEPINSTIKQFEAKLNYAGQGYNLSAGYYGSFYSNANGSLRAVVPNQLNNPLGNLSTLFPAAATTVIAGGGTSLQNVLQLPMALAPDNEAHQFYVSGNAKLSATTSANFKYAYTHATQTEDFASMGLLGAPAGVSNLGGVVDTNLFQVGITSRPIPKLTLLANLRYEDKDDRTPEALYNVEGGTSTPATNPPYTNRSWFNYRASSTKLNGKLEASYQLPADLRGTVGLDYSTYDRPVPVSITEEELAGLGAVRAKNEEMGYRLELRRSMSETLTGAIGYSNSKRTGSDWTSLRNDATSIAAGLGYGKTGPASAFLALSATNAFPMNMVDIDREKVKLSANWTPSEELEIQFYAESGLDKNVTASSPIAGGKGWRETGSSIYSVDASYAVSDNWKLTGYVSQGMQDMKLNHSTGYLSDIKSNSDAIGFGVVGAATGRLEVGANVVYLNDTTKYGIAASPSATGAAASAANLQQAAVGLPDVVYQTTTLSLYAKYALDKKSSIKAVLVSQQAKLNEWSYGYNGVPYLYSDSTTVSLKQDQTTNFFGVAYVMKF
jgi:MtrB/PioB family decaheme-associated outer membrane protein